MTFIELRYITKNKDKVRKNYHHTMRIQKQQEYNINLDAIYFT